MPKRKDEICLYVMDEKFVDWEISREDANSVTPNDQSWNARRASARSENRLTHNCGMVNDIVYAHMKV